MGSFEDPTRTAALEHGEAEPLLTVGEHAAVGQAGELYNALCRIVETDPLGRLTSLSSPVTSTPSSRR